MTRAREYTWEDMVAAIGQDFGADEEHVADEAIDYNTVARFCEPWEIGNLIYWDKAVAKQAGYRDVVAPWSGLRQTWANKGYWRPGNPTRFPKDVKRDESSRGGASFEPRGKQMPQPPTRAALFTDLEIEFFEPACVGDRLTVKGLKVVSVRPRQTKAGYGAFVNTLSDIYNQRGQLVVRLNHGRFSYNPGEQRGQS